MNSNNKIQPLLSICIPTCLRPEILRQTLAAIYNEVIDHSLFEVCITDNSETNETEDLLLSEFSDIDNLHYKHVQVKGFLNSIEALKLGNGKFLKLHNDYSVFKKGTLNRMVSLIKKEDNEKSLIFFSMGMLNNKSDVMAFNDFDSFMFNISYFSTWSSGFAIWKDDFIQLLGDNIDINYMYPHTSFLFNLTNKNKYIVDDFYYVDNVSLKKKGGYNLVDNFVRIYLTMVDELKTNGFISAKTYSKIVNNIMRFCAYWYNNVKIHGDIYTFTFDNYSNIIKDKCGTWSLLKFEVWKRYFDIRSLAKKVLGKNGRRSLQ